MALGVVLELSSCSFASPENPHSRWLTLCDPGLIHASRPVPHIIADPAIARRCGGLDLECSVGLHIALLPPPASSLVAAVGFQCREDKAQGSILPQSYSSSRRASIPCSDPAGLINSASLTAGGAAVVNTGSAPLHCDSSEVCITYDTLCSRPLWVDGRDVGSSDGRSSLSIKILCNASGRERPSTAKALATCRTAASIHSSPGFVARPTTSRFSPWIHHAIYHRLQ